jgi:hypothetical protein
MAKISAIYKPFSSSRNKFQTGISLNRVFHLPEILHGSSPISFHRNSAAIFLSMYGGEIGSNILLVEGGRWGGGFLTDNEAADAVGHCAFYFSGTTSEPTHKKGRTAHYQLLDHPCSYGI